MAEETKRNVGRWRRAEDALAKKILTEIQHKVMSSAALNGGFDTLLSKIDSIETNVAVSNRKIDSIYDAIYAPDKGLYARIKDVEHVSEEYIDEAKTIADIDETLKTITENVDDLLEFKKRITSIVNWIVLTMAAGGAGILGKIIWTLISTHVKFI